MVRYFFYTIGDLTYQSPLVYNQSEILFTGRLRPCRCWNSDCATEVLRKHMLELYIAEWQNDGETKVSFDTNTKRSASLIA